MKKVNSLLVIVVMLVLVGCGKTNDYAPAADASGEAIFGAVCTECHTPISREVVMVIGEGVANKDGIIKKVQSGSRRMSAFPNIQGEAADRLAEYVLANSQTK